MPIVYSHPLRQTVRLTVGGARGDRWTTSILFAVVFATKCASAPGPPLRFAFEPPPITGFRYGPAALAVQGPLVAVVDAGHVLDKGPARLTVLRRDPLRFQTAMSINVRALPTSASFAVAFESSRALWLVVSGAGGAHVARITSNADGSNWTEEWDRLPSVGPISAIAAGRPGTLFLLDAEYYRVVELTWADRRRRPFGSARELGFPQGLWYDKGRIFTLLVASRIEVVSLNVDGTPLWERTEFSTSLGDDSPSARLAAARWREGLFTFDAGRRTLYVYKQATAQIPGLGATVAVWLRERHPWLVGGISVSPPTMAAANGHRLCFGSTGAREVRCFEAVFNEPKIGGGPLPKSNR